MRLSVSVGQRLDHELAAALDSLAAAMPYGVHLTGAWLSTYAEECMPPNAEPLLLLARDELSGAVVGALPLRIEYVRGTRFWTHRRIVPLGRGPSDFFDVLAAPGWEERVCDEFADWLYEERRSWDLLDLDLLPGGSSAWPRLVEALQRSGFVVTSWAAGAFYAVQVSVPWSALEQVRYRQSLRDLLKDRRRLERERIEVRVCFRSVEICGLLPGMLDLYAQRREAKRQRNSFASPESRRFLFRAVEEYERRGWAELATLHGPDAALWAAQLGWVFHGTWYAYTIVMNPNFAAYSPGKLLVYELVKRCCDDPQIKELNFMRGEAPYKAQFATGKQPYYALRVENPWSVRLKLTRAASRLVAVRDAILR
jgi:CelD/BcsL family acetyltransferase involved in cellulose biosynthesis